MTTRKQFDFTDTQMGLLDSIEERTEAVTSAEVVRRSLTVMDHLVTKALTGEDLVITNDVLRLMLGMGALR